MYPSEIVMPMKAELTENGFEELVTPEDVDTTLSGEGTTLVMVNSVCGCAAGLARPAATQAVLQADNKPDHLVTVFAGQDKDATAKMREYFDGIEPSSPSMALLKGKDVVHFIPRHDIEGQPMEAIMENLLAAFSQVNK